uniref:Uncharacterized protein n=1 Tax=Opuntia streptacantha TaxID=393608 RepID=A0A7C8ZXH6_OPUST
MVVYAYLTCAAKMCSWSSNWALMLFHHYVSNKVPALILPRHKDFYMKMVILSAIILEIFTHCAAHHLPPSHHVMLLVLPLYLFLLGTVFWVIQALLGMKI